MNNVCYLYSFYACFNCVITPAFKLKCLIIFQLKCFDIVKLLKENINRGIFIKFWPKVFI